MLSGLSWAGFTLGASNFLYDLTEPQKRATYLAIHSVLASIGIFLGATLGGFLGIMLPLEIETFGVLVVWSSSLLGVFAVSALLRMLVLLVLMPTIKEVRRVRRTSFSRVIFRVTRVHALAGLVFDIVGTKPKPAPEARPGDSD
jgi:MFS family permease